MYQQLDRRNYHFPYYWRDKRRMGYCRSLVGAGTLRTVHGSWIHRGDTTQVRVGRNLGYSLPPLSYLWNIPWAELNIEAIS